MEATSRHTFYLVFPDQKTMVWTRAAFKRLSLFSFSFLGQGVTPKPRLDWNSGQSSSLSLPSGGIETRIFKAKVNRKDLFLNVAKEKRNAYKVHLPRSSLENWHEFGLKGELRRRTRNLGWSLP